MAIEEARSLLVKSRECIEASEPFVHEVQGLEERALMSGNSSKGMLGEGLTSLRAYLSCMSHIPSRPEDIAQSIDAIHNKRGEAISHGAAAYTWIEASLGGITTFVATTKEAQLKTSDSNLTDSVLGHLIKAESHIEAAQVPHTSLWANGLRRSIARSLEGTTAMLSSFITAHEATREEPAKLDEFLPRLEIALRLLVESKESPAKDAARYVHTAMSKVGETDNERLIDVGGSLMLGVHEIEESQNAVHGVLGQLSMTKVNINNLLKEL